MIVITRDKFIMWCDRVMVFSFYALIYFLPISIALSETFTGMALGFYLFKRGAVFYGAVKARRESREPGKLRDYAVLFLRSYKPVNNCLNWPIAALLFVSMISVLISPFRMLSFNGFLGKVLQSAFLYFNFIECINTKKRMRTFLTVFAVSCTLICINGIFQAVVGHGFIFGQVFNGRMSSSLRAPNDFGAYLIVVLPILYCLAFMNGHKNRKKLEDNEFSALLSKRVRAFCIALFLVALVCLGLTYSRGAWVGLILSLLVFGALNRRFFMLFILIIIIFLAVFYPKLTTERKPISDKKTFLEQNNRLKYWERASDIIKDYPLFGCGLNTYALIGEGYSAGWGGYPHNSFLQMTAETGIVGLSAFLWMLTVLFKSSFKALKRLEILGHRINIYGQKMLFFGVLTGLLAFLIHSFFDTNFYSVQLGSLMWILFGMIVALQRLDQPNPMN